MVKKYCIVIDDFGVVYKIENNLEKITALADWLNGSEENRYKVYELKPVKK